MFCRFCIVFGFAAALLAVASGCHSARYLSKDGERGVVAIPRNTNRYPNYRNQANELMLEHFPSGYVIEREEEVVVGETTRYHEGEQGRVIQASDETIVQRKNRNGSATTVPKTEYRIYYRKK